MLMLELGYSKTVYFRGHWLIARILVTHALHILDKTDYIYVIDDGKIVEEGTYHVCFELDNEKWCNKLIRYKYRT